MLRATPVRRAAPVRAVRAANVRHISSRTVESRVRAVSRSALTSVSSIALRPVRCTRLYGAGHGHHEEHGHHPPPKSLADEFGQPIEYDKDGNKITGQGPFFYAEVRSRCTVRCRGCGD